jgi:hypothetical protein
LTPRGERPILPALHLVASDDAAVLHWPAEPDAHALHLVLLDKPRCDLLNGLQNTGSPRPTVNVVTFQGDQVWLQTMANPELQLRAANFYA